MQSVRTFLILHKEALLALAFGIVLRLLYIAATPYGLRGHDVGGHIEYFGYVLEHWTIPDPHSGFEMYQAPLYYFIGSLVVVLCRVLGSGMEKELIEQYFSFVLSLITLAIAVWSASLLFPKKKDVSERVFFMLLIGTFPALVFFSARINNDTLYQVFGFLAFAFLLLWWKRRTVGHWAILCALIGVGMLSKSNMILWAPIAILALCAARKVPLRRKIEQTILLALIPLLIAGWFQVPRFFEESEKRAALVGNVGVMTGPISSAPLYMLTFNPVEIVLNPFNHISGDESRRLYHWEYFFRSAFSGEFEFPGAFAPFAVGMLVCALLLIPFAFIRLVDDLLLIRSSPWAPVAIAAVVLLLGAFAYRLALPFSACQDFRFSIVLALPWSAYMVKGVREERGVWKWLHILLCIGLIAFCAAFIVMIFFLKPS